MVLNRALGAAKKYALPMEPFDAAYKVAHTAMTGKSAEDFVENLADLCAKKAASIAEPSEIKLLTFSGKPQDAELIEGVVVLKAPAAPGMPEKLKGKIMLLEPEFSPPVANVSIVSPAKIAEIAQMQKMTFCKTEWTLSQNLEYKLCSVKEEWTAELPNT